jgi:hypothetical protein
LGCAGHFIGSDDCRFRRHTQVGNYRISTVGDYQPREGHGRERLGAGADSFFETYVFATLAEPALGNDGCGCRKVPSFDEIDGERYATTGEAQAGHERYVAKYLEMA